MAMRITHTMLLAVILLFPKYGWAEDKKSSGKQPDATKKSSSSVWMKVKLKSTENILRGLTLGDFDLIEENARRMNNFGRLEKLVHSRNAEYQTQLKFLEHANQELMRQAEKKNLDGATLAFVQLTTSCINCHRTIRDGKRDPKPDPIPAKMVWTHSVKQATAYYLTGPQQGRPADGELAKGTKVRRIKQAGSYCQVETEDGKTAYVSCDALKPRRKKSRE
jgi:hypothetical protein